MLTHQHTAKQSGIRAQYKHSTSLLTRQGCDSRTSLPCPRPTPVSHSGCDRLAGRSMCLEYSVSHGRAVRSFETTESGPKRMLVMRSRQKGEASIRRVGGVEV
jgi:hypothetical protein